MANVAVFDGFKLLLVEDDSLYQQLLIGKFEKLGIQVEVAVNALIGLQKLKSQKGEFNIIITDIKLPGKSGIEFAKEVRKLPAYKNTPIVTITGYPNKEIITRAAGSGLNIILVKPFAFEKLGEIILKNLKKKDAA